MMQFQITRNVFIAHGFCLINTVQVNDFLIVMLNEAIHMMFVILTRQINTTYRPIAQRTFLVFEIVHIHIGTKHHLSFRIHIMQRSTQPSVHIRHIRNNTLELLQTDARKFHGHFLIGYGVFAVGVEMNARALVIV